MEKQTFRFIRDKTPKYTIKEVADLTELAVSTIRYYDNAELLPAITRTDGNARMFSDYSISWVRLVHALRSTGLAVEEVKHYIDLCQEGDITIDERSEIINKQEKILRQQMRELKRQMEVLKYKKTYYKDMKEKGTSDTCNPKIQELI